MRKKLFAGVMIVLCVWIVILHAAPDGAGRGGRRGRGPMGGVSPNKPSVAMDSAENKILDVLADMYQSQRRGMMNVSPDDGRFMRMLAEHANAQKIVEIGTSNGYSGIWFCLALSKTGGELITHDINEERAKLARENFKRAGVEEMVTLVMGDAHETVMQIEGPIDILFLDADKSGYMDYLDKLLDKMRDGGLILAHNTTNAGPQMQDYLDKVTSDKNLDTIFIHSQAQGIGVTLKKRGN